MKPASQMRENLRIASLIMIVAGAVMAWVAHGRGKERAALEAAGKEVTGIVVEATVKQKTGRRSGTYYWLRVSYCPEGSKEAITQEMEVTQDFFNQISDGDQMVSTSVQVVYRPDKPEEAIIRGGSPTADGTFVVFLMLTISGAGLCVFLLTLIGRSKSPTSNGVARSEHGLEWLAETLGPAPRDTPLLESFWTLLKSKCSSKAEIDAWALSMRIDALALWGIRIKANRYAYEPASKKQSFYGLVLLAPKLPVGLISSHLLPVAEAIWKLTRTFDPDWSDEVQDFMQWVDDDLVHEWDERVVPAEISGGIECILTTGLFRKADMLGGAMAIDLIPALYDPDKKLVTLVPPKCWPASYKTEWLTELDKNLKSRKSEKEAPDSFSAFEVTGLPPASLINLEAVLEDLCQKNKVECCFLNTGNLQDSDRKDIPSSGELQFLGKFSQYEAILHTLGDAMEQSVPKEERSSIKVRSMNLAEFFERFNWLLEELQNTKIKSSES